MSAYLHNRAAELRHLYDVGSNHVTGALADKEPHAHSFGYGYFKQLAAWAIQTLERLAAEDENECPSSIHPVNGVAGEMWRCVLPAGHEGDHESPTGTWWDDQFAAENPPAGPVCDHCGRPVGISTFRFKGYRPMWVHLADPIVDGVPVIGTECRDATVDGSSYVPASLAPAGEGEG